MTFRYASLPAETNFTRTIAIEHAASAPGVTRVFLPVFQQFAGVDVSDPRAGCVVGVYRFTDLTALPLLLGATLPPDWRSQPLYQRLAN